ncbi:MAG: response regulator [Leadbetterella sp.]|nr:response regulator [Leadbetterella sp.]
MAAEKGKKKLLVLDDSHFDLQLIASQLEGSEFEVFLAQDVAEAVEAMQNHRFAVVMIDINLGAENGSQVGRALREADPNMATILMTGAVGNFRDAFAGFDEYIVKGCCEDVLLKIIRNTMYKRAMPREVRLRRLQLLHGLYPCKELLAGVYRRVISETAGDLEKLVGKLVKDQRFISWNVYNLAPNTDMFTVSCVSTVGCVGRCKFCLHGREPLIRLLDWQEMAAQVLHSLDSLLAKGVFDLKRVLQPRLHFTGMGEPLSNLKNVMLAIKKLASIKELDFKFIITTIGREDDLRALVNNLDQLGMDLSRLRLYLSINFPNPEMRAKMMPATKGQDLEVVRGLARKFEEATGNPVTASFIFVPGLNDGDAEGMARDWGKFDIKLQAFAPSPGFAPLKTATKHQLKQFQAKLLMAGANNVRIRTVIGGSDNAGCGSNSPDQELLMY